MQDSPTDQTASANARPTRSKQETRAVVSGTLGSALEYFDFAIYGALAASLFPKLFFEGMGTGSALLASFATFGVGFFARPVGALLFGHLGDRIGRRRILIITLILMGVSTAIIGLLPTGQGMTIAALLVLLRFVQGFSLGGEATGNQLMVIEHSHRSRRGFFSSLVAAGSPLSQVFALLVLTVLTAVLTEEQWESWGWRIPFIGGLAIVAVAAYIRRSLEETPEFAELKDIQKTAETPHGSGLQVLREEPIRVLRLVVAIGGTNFCYYVVAVYGIAYLSNEVGLATDTTFFVLMVGNGVSIIAAILGGITSDRFGRKRPVIAANFAMILFVILFFGLAGTASLGLLILLTVLTLCSVQFVNGIQPTLFAEQFPTRIRFAGSAISLTLSVMIFASLAPFIATAVTELGGTILVVVISVSLLVISIITLATLRENAGDDPIAVIDGEPGPTTAATPATDADESSAEEQGSEIARATE